MKKNLLRFGLSLIALFVMVVANAQTYQNEEASVSWPFNDDNYATQYTKSPENGFSLVSVNTGDLKYSLKPSQTYKRQRRKQDGHGWFRSCWHNKSRRMDR